MRPHKDSDDLGRLAHGCFSAAVLTLAGYLIIAVACGTLAASEPTAVYVQYINYEPNIGVAWCIGCPDNATKLGAYYHYACCSICPPPGSRQIPILRPGTWWADCPGDYSGHMLIGNEGEFRGQDDMTPAAMAAFITNARAEHPQAIFVCINSYDLDYAAAVIALLPPGTCEIIGVHTPAGSQNISAWLDGLCVDCRIWLTEMSGFSNSYQAMYNQTYQALADKRVERVFLYTAVGGTPASLDAIRPDGTLHPNGLAFKAVAEAYP